MLPLQPATPLLIDDGVAAENAQLKGKLADAREEINALKHVVATLKEEQAERAAKEEEEIAAKKKEEETAARRDSGENRRQ
ncbi:hypothetical protein VE00_04388 [Pseudogymnoascus sp. WSF 3629]|nr:hypothetical protein VE00_04388 [Pseudogymnoascus sp. WSF 3629]